MNCEPCNSLEITCNRNVTIGYLKRLVANIPSECCTTITVKGDDDTYCPTYGELMSGDIIPCFVDGGRNAWSRNEDGITINAGYSRNQCVATKDLKLIYTAFERLVVDNDTPIVSECGGSSTFSKTLIFRKYTIECDALPTSVTGTDDVLDVDWTGTDSEHSPVKTYPRNESFTDEHMLQVYCRIRWRDCNYSSINVMPVKQKVRQFDHNVDYSRSSGTSLDVQCYPREFGCNGGTSVASATYYYTEWIERHYIDTCGFDYDQENISIVNRHTDVSSYLNATSHTYTCQVTTSGDSKFTFQATYDGFSDSDTCYQVCGQCAECPPKPYTAYTDVEVPCTALSATVHATAYTFNGGTIDEHGNCVGWTSAATDASYTRTWNCNTAGGWIDDHIHVIGAPCCPTNTAYTFDDYTTQCEAENSKSVSVNYTCEIHNADGTTTITTGTASKTIPAHNCNSGSTQIELQSRIVAETVELARPKVIQRGGPCCPTSSTYTYDDYTTHCEAELSKSVSVKYTCVTINPDTTTSTTTGTSSIAIPSHDCNAGATRILLQQGHSGSTLASAAPNIWQAAGPCCSTSSTYTYDDYTTQCEAEGSKSVSVNYTCVTINPDTTTSTTTGTSSIAIPSHDCNTRTTRILLQQGHSGSTLASAAPTIWQAAGPCCSTGDVFTYNDVTVPCTSAASTTENVTYTQVHTNPDGTTTTTTGTNSITIPSHDFNTGTTQIKLQEGHSGSTLASAVPTIWQAIGPCCPTSTTYTYDEYTTSCQAELRQIVNVGYTLVVAEDDCTTSTTRHTNSITIQAHSNNTGTTRILLQQGHSGTTLADAVPTIWQAAGPCCPVSSAYTYDDYEIVCTGNMYAYKDPTINWTCVTKNANCTTTTTTGSSKVSVPQVSCNTASTEVLVQAGHSGATLSAAVPRVTQAAGPCCPVSSAYTYDDYITQCEAETSKSVTVGLTCVVHHADGTTSTSTTPSIISIPSHECNTGSTQIVLQQGHSGATSAEALPTIIQDSGPCCEAHTAYTYDDYVIPCTGTTGGSVLWPWTCVEQDSAGHITTTTGKSYVDIPARDCNPDSKVKKVRTRIVSNTPESSRPSIKQAAGPCCCACSSLTIASSAVTIQCGATRQVAYTADCTTITSVTSTNSAIATANTNTSGVITIAALSAGTATINVNYTANGNTCTKTISVTTRCGEVHILPSNGIMGCSGGTITFTGTTFVG